MSETGGDKWTFDFSHTDFASYEADNVLYTNVDLEGKTLTGRAHFCGKLEGKTLTGRAHPINLLAGRAHLNFLRFKTVNFFEHVIF
jgi:hypothetical protein